MRSVGVPLFCPAFFFGRRAADELSQPSLDFSVKTGVMLGLGAYDDSPSVEGESPAPANAEAASDEPVPVGAQSLSIVDYYDGEGEAEPAAADNGTGVLGVTLDDEAVQHATQRRVGGVQISVVKKNAASLPSAVGASSDAEAVAAEPSGSGTAAAFELPASPPGSLPKEMEEKFRGLIEKTREGYRVNEHIRNAKAFRNPDILEKLVAFFDVRESGTNYPPELYDTQELSKEDFFEKLEEARRKWEERQARKPGEKLAFASGGTLNPAAAAPGAAHGAISSEALGAAGLAARAAAAALAAKPGARKSKWGAGQEGGDDPEAKRPHA